MLQPNVEMTWEEMVEKYPARWVFVEVTEGSPEDLRRGIVKYVCTDDEMPEILSFCNKHRLDYVRERTIVEPFTLGIVEGVNCTIKSKVIYDE